MNLYTMNPNKVNELESIFFGDYFARDIFAKNR